MVGTTSQGGSTLFNNSSSVGSAAIINEGTDAYSLGFGLTELNDASTANNTLQSLINRGVSGGGRTIISTTSDISGLTILDFGGTTNQLVKGLTSAFSLAGAVNTIHCY